MLKKTLMTLAISGLFAVLIYSGPPARATMPSPAPLRGNYVVEASGTAYFYTATNGQTEVLHFTMAGSASFDAKTGKNTAVNLTLNLGGEDDYSSQNNYNELTCYLTQPGDLFYTAGTPAMLTVTYQAGDACGNPNGLDNTGLTGLQTGVVSEMNNGVGNVIPFNFYPKSWGEGGVIVSNYTSYTTGGNGGNNYPHGWIDSGSTYGGGSGSHVIYGMSVTGKLTDISR